MVGLAIALFIGVFAFGHQAFGWSDPSGQVQIALFLSFVLGIICGYRSKG